MSNLTEDQCSKCSELRDLDLHLYELALFCELLNNERNDEDGQAIRTETISKWLKLASYLEKVEIDVGKFSLLGIFCEPAMAMEDSESKHHSQLSFALTRFLYVTNALEELYRFASPHYVGIRTASGTKWDKASMQTRQLLNHFTVSIKQPLHIEHLTNNYIRAFSRYLEVFPNKLVNISSPEKLGCGLDYVRNFRYFVAHGRFPLIDDPDYNEDRKGMAEKRILIYILNMSCRITALSMQMLLPLISCGFQPSDRYSYLAGDPDTGDLFKEHCTFDYLTNLHIKQPFGINEDDWYNFSYKDGYL